MNNMRMGKTQGELFVDQLQSGEFKKNFRPNHGPDFTGGLEEQYRYIFNQYMSSCGCFLMDMRLVRREYHG